MEYIGKSNKFYTLWDVYEDYSTTSRGERYTITHHQYIKNISFDKDVAIKKYPNAIFDETLKGHSSWVSYDYPKLPNDEFHAGKYRGDKIADCTDYKYLYWAYDLGYIIPYESRNLVESILTKAGYKRINDSKIATPEEVEAIEKSFNECESFQEILDKENKIKVSILSNPDEDGNIKIGNIKINFPNLYWNHYNGYEYALPINASGKAKRIKNKEVEIIPESYNVEINPYGWGATLNIIVKDFNVLKLK